MNPTPLGRAPQLDVQVEVVPGIRPRLVRVEATTDPTRIPRIPPHHWLAKVARPPASAVIDAFLAVLERGCLYAPAGPYEVLRHEQREAGGLLVEGWDLSFAAMPEGAFDTLVRTAEATAMTPNGLTFFSVVEQEPTNLARVGRSALHPLGDEPWPFALDNQVNAGEQKDVSILITFVDAVMEPTFDATRSVLEAWGRVLSWGGFLPAASAGAPASSGFVGGISTHLDEEVVANIQFFAGASEAWAALYRGMLRVHATAPVLSVEVG